MSIFACTKSASAWGPGSDWLGEDSGLLWSVLHAHKRLTATFLRQIGISVESKAAENKMTLVKGVILSVFARGITCIFLLA